MDAGGKCRVCTVAAGVSASISELSISGGNAGGSGDDGFGGGIFASGCTSLTIANCIIESNDAASGAGIYLEIQRRSSTKRFSAITPPLAPLLTSPAVRVELLMLFHRPSRSMVVW